MAQPAQSYAVLFSAFLHPLAGVVSRGYAVTKSQDGTGYVVATTANLAISASGTIDGVALEDGSAFGTIPVQKDAEVFSEIVPWLGAGAIESAVVDANGKVQRASAAAGIVIGSVTKDGAVKLQQSGAIVTSLAGDATGAALANTVVAIRNATIPALAGNVGKVLLLSALGAFSFVTYGSATSGYDTADHGGGGQEVLSATGVAGAFNVRGAAVVTYGASPAASGTALRLRAAATNDLAVDWQFARRSGAGTNDVMVLGAASDGAGQEDIFIGSGATGTPNTRVKISTNGSFQLRIGSSNPAVDATATLWTFGPTDAAGMPIAFGTTPATTGLIRTAHAQTIVASKNNADLANIAVLATNSSDHVLLGNATVRVGPLDYFDGVSPSVPMLLGAVGGYSAIWFSAAVSAPGLNNYGFLGDGSTLVVLNVDAGGSGALRVSNANALAWTSTGVTVASLAGSGTRIATASSTGLLGSTAVIGVANGGTGLSAPGTSGNVLTSNGSAWVSSTPAATGPGGSTTQMQYNNAGAFGGTAEFTYASSKLNVSSSGAITFGSAPAAGGPLRLSNNGRLTWRNAANTGDLQALTIDGGNNCYVGDLSNGHYLVTGSATLSLVTSSTTRAMVTSTSLTLSVANCAFDAAQSFPALSHVAQTSDVVTTALIIQAQSAWASASSNKNGGHLALRSGAAAAGGAHGTIYLQPGAGVATAVEVTASLVTSNVPVKSLDGGSGQYIEMGYAASIGYSGLWVNDFNNVSTYLLISNGTDCLINLPNSGGTGALRVTNTTVVQWASARVSIVNSACLALGSTSASMNSATNAVYVASGTEPSAAPSGGFYAYANSGAFSFWSGNSHDANTTCEARIKWTGIRDNTTKALVYAGACQIKYLDHLGAEQTGYFGIYTLA